MPSDLFLPKVNLDLFYPPFLERYLELKVRCRARGASYLCTFGYRTWDESDEMYALWKAGKGGKSAPGGNSSHNFGLAGDEALVTHTSPRICSWGLGDFKILAEEAARLGLHHGAAYNDWPHVSWPGFVSGLELQPLRDIWRDNLKLLLLPRLRKVWEYVDAHSAVPPFTPECP